MIAESKKKGFINNESKIVNNDFKGKKLEVSNTDRFNIRLITEITLSHPASDTSIINRHVASGIEAELAQRLLTMDINAVDFESLPKDRKPLVQAVIDFVDHGEDPNKIMVNAWHLGIGSEKVRQKKTGIYRTVGKGGLESRNQMDMSHCSVFMAILHKIKDENEGIRRAVLDSVAKGINEALSTTTGLKNNIIQGRIEVELITRFLFNQAYHLTQKNDYLLYTVANPDEGHEFFKARTEVSCAAQKKKRAKEKREFILRIYVLMAMFVLVIIYQLWTSFVV